MSSRSRLRAVLATSAPPTGDAVLPGAQGSSAVRRRGSRRRPATRADGGLAGLVSVVAALRSGAAVDDAWQRGLRVRTRDGLPLEVDLAARTDPRTAAVVLAAARLSHRTGAPAAAVLEEVVAGLHREAEEAAQRRAALAGPAATARLLAWLPALGLVLGVALGADPLEVLLDGVGGTALLGGGLLASAVGHGWTRRLTAAAVRAAEPR